MKVMICANLAKERSRKAAADACAKLNEIGFLPMIEKQYENSIKVDNAVYAQTDSLITDCDMFMTIGGDGTILKWGQKAAACNKLLLGINTGRLGFMTSIESGELDTLERLKTGEYTVSKLPEFIVSVEEYEVTKIRADGIIFSTPAGSTAYSLSAGGPIISPDAQCIEFTPLCAHSLFGRPMIFSADSEITVRFSAYEDSGVSIKRYTTS